MSDEHRDLIQLEDEQDVIRDAVKHEQERHAEAARTPESSTETMSETPEEDVPQLRPEFHSPGKDFINAMKRNPVLRLVANVLMWRHITISGLIFAIGNLMFFLVVCAEYPFLVVHGIASMFMIVGGAGYVKYMERRGGNNLLRKFFEKIALLPRDELLEEFGKSTKDMWVSGWAMTYHLMAATDPFVTCMVLAKVLLGTFLSIWIPYAVWKWTGFILAFIVPRLYFFRKDTFDNLMAKGNATLREKVEPLLAKVPGLEKKKKLE